MSPDSTDTGWKVRNLKGREKENAKALWLSLPGLLRNNREFLVARPKRGRAREETDVEDMVVDNVSFSKGDGSHSGVLSRGVTYELTGALCWVRIGSKDQGGSREP